MQKKGEIYFNPYDDQINGRRADHENFLDKILEERNTDSKDLVGQYYWLDGRKIQITRIVQNGPIPRVYFSGHGRKNSMSVKELLNLSKPIE